MYIVPGTDHKFRTQHDARYYCEQHGIDYGLVEVYDSDKEYERWLVLLQEQEDGLISDLRRQVEYEIIPAKYESVFVKNKTVKRWKLEHDVPFLEPEILNTRKEAEAKCRRWNLPLKNISSFEQSVQVHKTVCIEKNAVYTADFVYRKDGELVVEDVKSDVTRKEKDYVLRRKLMLHVHGIRILET